MPIVRGRSNIGNSESVQVTKSLGRQGMGCLL